jgi:hypothetical protein
MNATVDVVVLGSGPAAAAAGCRMSQRGYSSLTVSECVSIHAASLIGTFERGLLLRHADGTTGLAQARAIIAAPRRVPRIVPFSGWTSSLVEHGSLATAPARSRMLVAGSGPDVIATADAASRSGITLVGVVITELSAEEWRAAETLAGKRVVARVRAAHRRLVEDGVPVIGGIVTRAEDMQASLRIVVERDSGERLEFHADRLQVNHGSIPAIPVLGLLGLLPMAAWEPLPAGTAPDGTPVVAAGNLDLAFAPHLDERRGVRAADDAIRALARPATLAARSLPVIVECGLSLERERALVAKTDGSTLVCADERVTLDDVVSAIRDGAASLREIKMFTRLGMGACRGVPCAQIARSILAAFAPTRPPAVGLRARPPLNPVRLDELAEYDDR